MKKTKMLGVMLCVAMVVTVFTAGNINAKSGGQSVSQVGRIVVIADDWSTSDYRWSSSASIFTLNTFGWLTEFSSGKRILIDSRFDDYLPYNNMVNTLRINGYTVDIIDTTSWTQVLLENYDAVLIEIGPVDNTLLVEYVNGGGGVFLVGGNSGAIPDQYDGFLLNFGMSLFGPTYPGWVTLTNFVSHPVTNGVSYLQTLNPTPISIHSSEPIVLSTWGDWNWLVVYQQELDHGHNRHTRTH